MQWRGSTYRRKKIFPGIFESRVLGEWAVLLLVRTKTANIQRTRVCLTTTLPLPTFYKIYFPKLFSPIFRIFSTFFSNIRHRRFILTFYKKCFFPSFPKFWCPSRKSVQNHSLISSKLFQSLYSPTFFRYSPQMSNIYNSVDQNVAISFLVQKIFSVSWKV